LVGLLHRVLKVGSPNDKILAGADDFLRPEGVFRQDVFCSKCHIGYDNYYNNGSHPMGSEITVVANGNVFTQFCTTCHNPHIVRDANQYGFIDTVPDWTSDPAANPNAMGKEFPPADWGGWSCYGCHWNSEVILP